MFYIYFLIYVLPDEGKIETCYVLIIKLHVDIVHLLAYNKTVHQKNTWNE